MILFSQTQEIGHSTAPFILDKQVWVTAHLCLELQKKAGSLLLPKATDFIEAGINSVPVTICIYFN